VRIRGAAIALVTACGSPSSPATDSGVVRCNGTAPFQAPVVVGGIASPQDDVAARLSPDERVVVFSRRSTGGMFDLYTASRASAEMPFDPPTLLTTVNSVNSEGAPSLSPDELLIAFDSDRGGGATRIYTSTRDATSGNFGAPQPALALRDGEVQPLLANPRALYFTTNARPDTGAHDIWRAEIDRTGATSPPVAVAGGVNTAMEEGMPAVTADELHIFFRRVVGTDAILHTAQRSSRTDPFGPATAVENLGMPGSDVAPTWVSPDGCHLYFQSNAAGGAGGYDLYVSSRPTS
jgi:hypothetical protein